jgi:hypothetical protein
VRRVIGLAIAAVTLLAWVYLFHLSRQLSAMAADENASWSCMTRPNEAERSPWIDAPMPAVMPRMIERTCSS